MSEFDRRTFLRGVLKAGAVIGSGVAGGEFTAHARSKVEETVEDVTKHPTGNAGVRDMIEQECKS